jgi:hypothetical protein
LEKNAVGEITMLLPPEQVKVRVIGTVFFFEEAFVEAIHKGCFPDGDVSLMARLS